MLPKSSKRFALSRATNSPVPARPKSLRRLVGRCTCLGLLLGVVADPAESAPVYRCIRNGSVTYTQNASDPECEPIEVNAYEPDPETVSQKKDELRKWRDDRSKSLGEGRRKRNGKKQRQGDAGARQADTGAPDSGNGNLRIPEELDFKAITGEQ